MADQDDIKIKQEPEYDYIIDLDDDDDDNNNNNDDQNLNATNASSAQPSVSLPTNQPTNPPTFQDTRPTVTFAKTPTVYYIRKKPRHPSRQFPSSLAYLKRSRDALASKYPVLYRGLLKRESVQEAYARYNLSKAIGSKRPMDPQDTDTLGTDVTGSPTGFKRPRASISDHVKMEIIDFAKKNPLLTQTDIGQIFGIDRTTVSKIIKKYRPMTATQADGTGAAAQIDMKTPPRMRQTTDLDIKQESSLVKVEKAADGQPSFFNQMMRWYKETKMLGEKVTVERVLDIAAYLYEKCPPHQRPLAVNRLWAMSFLTEMAGSRSSDSAKGASATKASAAASKPPVSVTPATPIAVPVSTPSLVSRQRVVNNTPKATATSAPDTKGSSVAMETKVSSSTNEEPEKQELNLADLGIGQDLSNLNKMRKQQKQIEEANKQNKLLLAKKLVERQRKAKEEAQKLAQIQRDLVKLDNMLTVDVTLIQERIEKASREFVEAQKQFDKIEKDYNVAKLNLQRKSELKEQLTEHLNTVIHENEVRKASKLQELMTELEAESSSSNAIPLNSLPPMSSHGISDANTLQSSLASQKTSTSSSTSQVFSPCSSGSLGEPSPQPASAPVPQQPSPVLQPDSLVPQPPSQDLPQASSNLQPSSVLQPASQEPFPVSMSAVQQISIKQECIATENRIETMSPISIKSETSLKEKDKVASQPTFLEQVKTGDCQQKNDNPLFKSSQENLPINETKYDNTTIIKDDPRGNTCEVSEEGIKLCTSSGISTVTSTSSVSSDMIQLPSSWKLSLVKQEPID